MKLHFTYGKEEDNLIMCTNFPGNLLVIFGRISSEIIIKQVKLQLDNAEQADKIKLK